MAKARRGAAPTRAQQQAARPEYTMDVEQEKQVRRETLQEKINTEGRKTYIRKNVCLLSAGTRGGAPQDMRGGSGRARWSTRRAAGGAERAANTNGLQGLQDAPGQLPLHAVEVQVFPLQPSRAGGAGGAQGQGTRGGKEGAYASMATGGQR
eukprot:3090525-Pleurochrysis_carterae.AAC.1